MLKLQDQIGNFIELENTPKRIISLVPSQTELLVDLGLEEKIVGITKFCLHPSSLRKHKKIIGGTKNINFKKIIELKPDIILCNKEENTKEIVETCQQIANTHVSNIYSIDDVLMLTKQYGEIFSCKANATTISSKIKTSLNNFHEFIKEKETKKVVYFIWKNPWMVAANNTFINSILELNKFENIYNDKLRYPIIDLDKLKITNKYDFIFLSSEPYPFKENEVLELKSKLNTENIFLVNGEMFSWYGTRLLLAFEYFKTLHQNLS